jgi:hypothetical protein
MQVELESDQRSFKSGLADRRASLLHHHGDAKSHDHDEEHEGAQPEPFHGIASLWGNCAIEPFKPFRQSITNRLVMMMAPPTERLECDKARSERDCPSVPWYFVVRSLVLLGLLGGFSQALRPAVAGPTVGEEGGGTERC